MEQNTFLKCACCNCGEILEYTPTAGVTTIACPKCGETSQLPAISNIHLQEDDTLQAPEVRLKPKAPPCPVCGSPLNALDLSCDACLSRRTRKTTIITVSIVVALIAAAAGFLVYQKYHPPVSHDTLAQPDAAPKPSGGTIMILAQPEVKTPKSINDLHPLHFALEQKHGSDIAIAVGDIQNLSLNVHHNLKAEVDLLDINGVKIGSLSDVTMELRPHDTWHFIAPVSDTRARSIRFAGIKEDQ